ncbi:uncharacterized protein V6R79_002342 [Siganus canaliculatus]
MRKVCETQAQEPKYASKTKENIISAKAHDIIIIIMQLGVWESTMLTAIVSEKTERTPNIVRADVLRRENKNVTALTRRRYDDVDAWCRISSCRSLHLHPLVGLKHRPSRNVFSQF